MIVVATFAAAAIVTFALRASMVVAGDRLLGSDRLATVIALTSPAVLAAMIASALFVHAGEVIVPAPAEVGALAVAVVAVRRTGNVSAALAAGLPAFWILQALVR
ncbi:MAG: AzlD domain-containing protein [Acidimicrobiales bacterium]|nr:AzlD domain-containing protein [Acidimicrobiales bacterium]